MKCNPCVQRRPNKRNLSLIRLPKVINTLFSCAIAAWDIATKQPNAHAMFCKFPLYECKLCSEPMLPTLCSQAPPSTSHTRNVEQLRTTQRPHLHKYLQNTKVQALTKPQMEGNPRSQKPHWSSFSWQQSCTEARFRFPDFSKQELFSQTKRLFCRVLSGF